MVPSSALELLRSGVFVLAGVVALLFVALLVQHGVVALIGACALRREAALAPRLYAALDAPHGRHDPCAGLGRFDRSVLRGMLLRLALDLRGESADAIIGLYRSLGLWRADLARLRSWRASRRARAAADLGVIGDRETLPALLAVLADTDLRVRMNAVWAIGQLGDGPGLAGLVPLLADPSSAVARRAQEVLAEGGQKQGDAILAFAAGTRSRAGRLAAIELLGWLRLAGAAELLDGLMGDPDSETRVKSVKAAAAIGDPRFLESFHLRLADPRWEVRCQAAKGLSVLGSPESVPGLDAALRDDHWWVRFYAAVALAEIGDQGEAALAAALTDSKPLVRDMARYLLERGSAVPVLP